jgi:GNAT superfamily N-acetyltransferase
VAAIEGKQAVGFNWFGGGSIWIPELKKYLELRKNEVLLYDAYVASEWRNQGINSLILEYIQRYSKRGMSDKELILFAHNWNKPVHHLVTRRGFKLSGKIYFGSIFLVPYVIIRAKNIHLTKKK